MGGLQSVYFLEAYKGGAVMLKEMLALSDKGARDLKKGIAATAAAHLCVMLPVSLLMTVTLA